MHFTPLFPEDDWISDGFLLPHSVIDSRLASTSNTTEKPLKAADVVRNCDIPVPLDVYEFVAELTRKHCLLILNLRGPHGCFQVRMGGRERIYIDPEMPQAKNPTIKRMDSVQITQISWGEAA